MFINKWLTFSAAAALELVAGVIYAFSIYSPALKESLNISQTQLQGLGTAIGAGGFFAFIPGLLYDANISKYPKWTPRLIGAMGVIAHVFGYLSLWLAATERVSFQYWQLVAICLLASNSIVWLDTCLLATNIRNFPFEKGTIAGILKGFLGLSASICTTIYVGLFKPDQQAFLLFLALFPAALGSLALPLVNHVPFEEQSQSPAFHQGFRPGKRFMVAYGVLGALVVWQLSTSLLHALAPANQGIDFWLMCGTLAILACLAFVPWRAGGLFSHPLKDKPHTPNRLGDASAESETGDSRPLLQDQRITSDGQASSEEDSAAAATAADSNLVKGGGRSKHRSAGALEQDMGGARASLPDISLKQCLQTTNYWLLWCSLVIGMGAGFTYLSNLSQLVQSRGGSEDSQDIYISLFTTNNCLGRILAGWASERALHKYGCPRTLFLVGQLVLTSAVYACTAAAPLHALGAISLLGGLAFGGLWALMVALTSELFGVAHFAGNYSLMHLAPNAGSFFLATELSGILYERAKASHPGQTAICIGYDCFRMTFILVSIVSLASAALALLLYVRTRWIYQALYQQIQEHQEETAEAPDPQGCS
ncbi:hypothetical protein WJX84_006938 [Apatococcus fuscideae]|uniref:Nodulin-like domain-containing protein n=1 Tax=Apatococcus fuscideae TaxID=2026836 RepID=A0AAW1STD3_9CHLO